MLCKECETKPIARGVKGIDCLNCGEPGMASCNHIDICNTCSDELQKCKSCGKDCFKTSDIKVKIDVGVEEFFLGGDGEIKKEVIDLIYDGLNERIRLESMQNTMKNMGYKDS